MKKITLMLIGIFEIVFAQQYPKLTLDQILSMKEQKEIGISKLSDSEKEKLRLLIIEKYLAGFDQGKKDGFEQAIKYLTNQKVSSSSDVIESQIDGDFEGWEGETIVKLMNGQIWQQSEYVYSYHYTFMPKVVIYKSGSVYKMIVDGIDKAVGVIRLK